MQVIDAPTASFAASVDLAGALTQRLSRYFKVHIEDWCDVCRRSVAVEDQFFADDISPGALDEHGRLLDELERTGRFFQQSMKLSGFADQAMIELVDMTLQDLHDRRALWHGQLDSGVRKEILQAVFNES
jgi:hypothetical protein